MIGSFMLFRMSDTSFFVHSGESWGYISGNIFEVCTITNCILQ